MSIGEGFVINYIDGISNQCDLIVFDRQATPNPMLESKRLRNILLLPDKNKVEHIKRFCS